MSYLTTLKETITEQADILGIKPAQVDVWMEGGELEDGSYKETESGLHIQDLKYRACVAIDDLLDDNGQSAFLALLVKQFAKSIDEDNQQGLDGISLHIEQLDEKKVDVEITLGIREPQYVVEVQNSPIEFNGKKWGFGTATFNIATELNDVSADVKA